MEPATSPIGLLKPRAGLGLEPGTLECTVVAATLKVLKCTKLLAAFMTGMN